MAKALESEGFELQSSPTIVVTKLPGKWLLKHSTPSWRIKDRKKGFQRMVRQERAVAIARTVLDQGRTFPNAIILATDRDDLEVSAGRLTVPDATKFLVVDGQHRLWAQTFAAHEASYACLLHTSLDEVAMAKLFLEINDNQKRVPSSLRWDLVRLVRPEDDPFALGAAELVYELAITDSSPLYQRIDLTGEQSEIDIKQGSIAPEIKNLLSSRHSAFRELTFEAQYEALSRYLLAIRNADPSGWRRGDSPLAKARVLRVLLRLLPAVAKKLKKNPEKATVRDYLGILSRIDLASLAPDRIRAVQGSAGMREIEKLLAKQMGIRQPK